MMAGIQSGEWPKIARGGIAIYFTDPYAAWRRGCKENCNGLLQLRALDYNLTNFMRTLALPKEVEHWSLTTLRKKLVKIGAKSIRHGRYVTFQFAEAAVPKELFRKILRLVHDLRRRLAPAWVG